MPVPVCIASLSYCHSTQKARHQRLRRGGLTQDSPARAVRLLGGFCYTGLPAEQSSRPSAGPACCGAAAVLLAAAPRGARGHGLPVLAQAPAAFELPGGLLQGLSTPACRAGPAELLCQSCSSESTGGSGDAHLLDTAAQRDRRSPCRPWELPAASPCRGPGLSACPCARARVPPLTGRHAPGATRRQSAAASWRRAGPAR